MSERNKIKKVSRESIALKELRESADLSLRKLADLMNLSFMRVHQMESGREDVNEEYVEKFLKATNFNWEDWNKKTQKESSIESLRDKCHKALDSIDASKLEFIYGILMSI